MAVGRLHAVVGVEETVPDLDGLGPGARGPGRPTATRPGEDPWRELERLCLAAEREGPRGWAKVLPRLKQHVEANPRDSVAWGQLARAFLSQEDRSQALRAAQEALRLSDGGAILGFSVSLLLAQNLCKSRSWAAAARHCEAALASQPGEAEALEVLVWSRFGQDDAPRTETALTALAQGDAERAAVLAQHLAEQSKRAEDRRRWLSHASSWAKNPTKALKDLGEVCLVLRDDGEALQCFKRAFAQADGMRDADLARTLAQLQVRGGRVEDALGVYRAALGVAPDCLPLYRSCWQLLLKEGRAEEAMVVIKKGATAASPQEAATIYATLAELQTSLGQTSQALQSWQSAAEVDSGSVAAWKGLVNASTAAGARGETVRALRRLAQLEPECKEWPARLAAAAEAEAVHDRRSFKQSEPSKGAGSPAQPPSAPAASPGPATRGCGGGEGWRDGLHEGQAVEVYSKSACRWLASKVAQVAAETVKVKYIVDGQWCEKALLRSSDSLRLMADAGPPSGEGAGAAAAAGGGEREALPRFGEGGPSCLPASASSLVGRAPPQLGCAGPAAATPKSAARAVAASPRAAPASPRAAPVPANPWAANRQEGTPPRRQWTAPTASSSRPSTPVQRHGTEPPERQQPEQRRWTAAPAGYPEPAARGPGGANGTATSSSSAEGKRPKGMLAVEELVFGEVLGTGGFGAVYRGTYRGQEVAVKRLHPAEGAMTPGQLEEFQKEVTNLSLLSHPRLIHLVGAAFQPPSLCIVTEFMPNGSLYSLLHTRRQQLTSPQKLAMSMQVTEGVGFLHGRSPPFVHRDLKSLNVVLDFSLNAKLCDFGLAQSMEKTHITRRENECGSPRYMAPELFDSRGKITEKVDIWSLGCLVLEVHLGKLPHAECTSLPQAYPRHRPEKSPRSSPCMLEGSFPRSPWPAVSVMDKTLLRRELPFSARGEVGEELWTLAELCLEFCPQRRVDVACLLEGLRGLAP